MKPREPDEKHVLHAIGEVLARIKAEDDKQCLEDTGNRYCFCTNGAADVVEHLRSLDIPAEVVGYATSAGLDCGMGCPGEEPNDDALVGGDETGHDFAWVMRRWVVDYWAVEWARNTRKMLLDLHKPADLREARRLYGKPWVDRVLLGPRT